MKIIVIGGGPAGMMAAITAAQNGAQVILLESNKELGRKLSLTGGGRCNITNNKTSEDFLNHVVSNNRFLYSALSRFSSADTINFFKHLGLDTKIENEGRVFPRSNSANDVVNALQESLKKHKVEVVLEAKVQSVSKINEHFAVKTTNSNYKGDKLIIATGGVTYPNTGSTGDGYKFAEVFSHKIVKPVAALSPIDLSDFKSSLAGISLKDVRASVSKDEKLIKDKFGELLFTHTGVSGPAVLSLSSYVNRLNNLCDARLSIDLVPKLSQQQLDTRLLTDFQINQNWDVSNIVALFMPKGMVDTFTRRLSFPNCKKVNEITKENRSELVRLLKDFNFKIKGLKDVNVAMVTAGGVNVREINPATMQSKLVGGLFFAGEVLDVDALTGGYNIQIALSTGYLAGLSAAKISK
jgi:hypothetical protein